VLAEWRALKGASHQSRFMLAVLSELLRGPWDRARFAWPRRRLTARTDAASLSGRQVWRWLA